MQPIRTNYKGILFRSKLEAEWAKFFDSLSIPWLYEPEGYQFTDGTMYLPDFWLPDSKQWFEVKGLMNDKDQHKMEMLCLESHHDVVIGYPDGEFSMMDLWKNDEFPSSFDPYSREEPTNETFYRVEIFDKVDTFLNKCKQCGKYSFMESCGSYSCQCCGAYDGDHYINWVMDGERDYSEPWYEHINTYEWRKRSRIDVRNNY